ERVALAAALLSERDPFPRTPDAVRVERLDPTASDVLDRVEALEDFEAHGTLDSHLGRLHRNTARFVLQARDQLLRLLRQEAGTSPPNPLPAAGRGSPGSPPSLPGKGVGGLDPSLLPSPPLQERGAEGEGVEDDA